MMFVKTMNSILALVFLSMFLSCQANDQKNTSPNVLMISVDDLNDWIGDLGVHPDVKTPNIDRLANEGFLFTNAHCQAPICGPSRASVMSGLRPSTTGIYGQIKDQNLRKGSKVMESVRFLPQYFKDQGYKTIGIGKIFHNHAPEGVFEVSGGRVRGFGPLPEKRMKWSRKGTSTDWGPYPDQDSLMYDYTYAQWTRKQLQETHDRPFFMAVGFIRPHVPWYAPQKWFDLYPPDQVTLPSYLPNDFDDLPEIAKRIAYKGMMPTTDWAIQSGEWKNIVQAYLACISFVDHQVGVVLEALENSEYKDNTIVVLWSDHGYEIGEKGSFGKHTLWSESTRVPLIFKFPRANSTQTIHSPVELLDIYPTLIDLTQLPKNPLNEGRSLLPLMQGSNDDRALAIITYGRDNHSLINQTHRYIHYEDGSEELYDLRIDPDERNNLADRIDSGPIKQVMMNRIPKLNVPWSAHSYNTVNEYFKRTSNSK